MFKHIPNILTISRIVMTFFFIYFLAQWDLNFFNDTDYTPFMQKAFIIFVVATATDFLDGFIARRYQFESNVGKILDPIADKFLVLSAFIILGFKIIFPMWLVVIVVIREVSVTITRLMFLGQGRVVAAESSGKIKTVMQMSLIGYTLLSMSLDFEVISNIGNIINTAILQNIWYGLMGTTLIMTVWSGIEFFYKNCFKKS